MSDASTYDELPYENYVFPRTHPSRLSALASLFGLEPTPPNAARVLELGCAAGSNLLPMAVGLPSARFVGVDLSIRQVEAGEKIRKEADIDNVQLRQADIMDIDASWGKFDYIIAHGLFSWVPLSVQQRILGVIQHNLTENGVAYVSFNTYPGWHFKRNLREMMLYHVSSFTDPATRILQARALVDFLAAHGAVGPQTDQMKSLAETLRKMPDSYLFHEYLEQNNHPMYFSEFAEMADNRNLAYLSDTKLGNMMLEQYKPEVGEVVKRLAAGDPIRRGQYLDFISNRTFREVLLVRKGATINRQQNWQAIRSLWFNVKAKLGGGSFDPKSTTAPEFILEDGGKIRLSNPDPLFRAALAILIENSPCPIHFDQLVAAVRARIGSNRLLASDQAAIGNYLLGAWNYGVIEAIAHPWPTATKVGDRPQTSKLARILADSNQRIATLRHEFVGEMSPNYRRLIGRLDGSHTVAELADALMPIIELPAGSTTADRRSAVAERINEMLSELRNQALLLTNAEI